MSVLRRVGIFGTALFMAVGIGVTPAVAASSAKDITAFSFTSPAVTGTINAPAKTIAVTVPSGTDVTNLVATFTLSDSATVRVGAVAQTSGTTANNFTTPVTYTVRAEDLSEQNWTVTVTVTAAATGNAITAFALTSPAASGIIDATARTVTVLVPATTPLTALVPTFTLSPFATAKVGNAAQTSGTTANDFTNAVTYVVTSQSGVAQNWVVTIRAPRTGKAFTAFSFVTPAATGVVDPTARIIAITVPHATAITSLAATFTLSESASAKVGGVTQISGTTANNFAAPVTYTVTAEDGTTSTWTVTVTVAASTATAVTAFAFTSPTATGTINATNRTIAVTVPFGTNLKTLAPTFALSAGATAKVGNIAQVSGTTANDFTAPVTYVVTADNGVTTASWVVTVTVAANTAADVTAFGFVTPPVAGVVDPATRTITVTVPYGTARTALVPTFALSAGAAAMVGPVTLTNGVTAVDFTAPVTITVTAANGTSTQTWTVNVKVAAPPRTLTLSGTGTTRTLVAKLGTALGGKAVLIQTKKVGAAKYVTVKRGVLAKYGTYRTTISVTKGMIVRAVVGGRTLAWTVAK